ncbi:MAG: PD-(D/E)XK nuclease family protein [Proteobacteria bacterium]|nr:PD-(D/E)XK nuclease family protein [Pseudomonadota bacterium]
MSGASPASSRVLLGRGPRQVEERLMAELSALLEPVRENPALLASPVRVLVPSRSLRAHVASTLVRRTGRAVAGVVVQTLHGLALDILEGAGDTPPGGEALLPVLVRRAAREERALAGLDELEDAYGAVEATVRDLLDAGFTAEHGGAVDECLAELADGGADATLARALARVAGRVWAHMEHAGVQHRSGLLRRATEHLEERGGAVLPSRAVLVHGFADATGVATELVRALQAQLGAVVLLDAAAVPDNRTGPRASSGFALHFRERIESHPATEVEAAPPGDGPIGRLAGIDAPGAHAEVRCVVERVRDLLDRGVRAESIALVARDPEPYVLPIRHHCRRLAVPFSGFAAAGPGGAHMRRCTALLDLLDRGPASPVDRWLDAWTLSRRERADLRLGLRHLGAARLGDVAQLTVAGPIPLPVRRGLSAAMDGDDTVDESGRTEGRALSGPRAPRRSVGEKLVARAVEAAAALIHRMETWPASAPGVVHQHWLAQLLRDDLGWRSTRPGEGEVLAALDALAGDLPEALALSADEFRLLVRRSLRAMGSEPVGGRGGGVQVLGVMEARAHTFDHLFVLGMNRDVFPRTIREDPLLPDRVRAPLTQVLPALPVKRAGHDEERVLFAQLVASSPEVTLCWQSSADDGKPRARSTFVEQLCYGDGPPLEITAAPPALAPLRSDDRSDRPALELARLGALYGAPAELEPLLELALREGVRGSDRVLPLDAAELARFRLCLRDEFDRDPSEPSRLGPYFGLVGPPAEDGDPRAGELYVTTLESTSRCPWQAFVERILRVERMPDPFEALPEVDPLRLGNLVHAVLERIAREAGCEVGGSLDEAWQRDAVRPAWPPRDELRALLRQEAAALLGQAARTLPGLVDLFVARAAPLLARARELDWGSSSDGPQVIGVEVAGSFGVKDASGAERVIHFRADRVDRHPHGPLLTDYKTGKPVSDAAGEDTRRAHLQAKVRGGSLLQACAYASAAESAGTTPVGRYLYLKADIDPVLASVSVAAEDPDLLPVFDETARILIEARDTGCFTPRLVKPDNDEEAGQCQFCEVKEACLWGDSGARGRLRRWLDEHSETSAALSPAERSLVALWDLQRGRGT